MKITRHLVAAFLTISFTASAWAGPSIQEVNYGRDDRYRSGSRDYDKGSYGQRRMSQMSRAIDQAIQDPDKAMQARRLLRQIFIEAYNAHEQQEVLHERLYDLNASYNARPEDFIRILDDLNNSRMAAASRMLKLRFQLRDILSPREWSALTEVMERERRRSMHDGGYGHEGYGHGKGYRYGYGDSYSGRYHGRGSADYSDRYSGRYSDRYMDRDSR